MLKELREGQKRIEKRLDNQTQILNEHTQILRALEHSAEVNKAEDNNSSSLYYLVLVI